MSETTTTTKAAFLPDDYEVPSGGSANYTKLETGDTRLRILSQQPLIGHISWVEGKPRRARNAAELPSPSRPDDKVREFWAMKVYNYDSQRIEIWEITQMSIKNVLANLVRDPEWGNPSDAQTGYGIKVTRSGSGIETQYGITPGKAGPLPAEIAELAKDTPVVLSALMDGDDPFEVGLSASEDMDDDIPFN